MATKVAAYKALIYGAGIAAAVVVVYVILVGPSGVSRILFSNVCLTDTEKTIPNLSGMEFDFIYTNCDTLAKEAWISVYVTEARGRKESLLERLLNHEGFSFHYDGLIAEWTNEDLLFRYDPGGFVPGYDDNLLPVIQSPGNDRILVYIPRDSEVLIQRRRWRSMTVNYITQPDP